MLLNLTVTDSGDHGVVGLDHGALRFTRRPSRRRRDGGLAVDHLVARLASGHVTLDELGDDAAITGDRAALVGLLAALDQFDASFTIVTP